MPPRSVADIEAPGYHLSRRTTSMQKRPAPRRRRRSNRPGNSQATGLHAYWQSGERPKVAHRRGTGRYGSETLRYQDRWGVAVI